MRSAGLLGYFSQRERRASTWIVTPLLASTVRIIIRILGITLLALVALGLVNGNSENSGPEGTIGAIRAGAGVLDLLLLFLAGVGLIGLSFYKRPRPSDTTVAPPPPSPPSQITTAVTDPGLRQTLTVASEDGTNISSERNEDSSQGLTEVSIRGYREVFAMNPRVKVFWNEATVGEVGRDGSFQFMRRGNGTLKFKSSFRSAAIDVPSGANVVVQLAWDRISGKLIVHVVP